jgi:hypothetical protein
MSPRRESIRSRYAAAKYLAAAAAGVVVASVISARARRAGRPAANPEAGVLEPAVPETQTPHTATADRKGGIGLRLSLAAVAVAAGFGAAVAARHQSDIADGSLLLTSMLLSGLALRGLRLFDHRFFFVVLFGFFAAMTVAAGRVAIIDYQQLTDPGQLLLLAAFSLCGLAILFLVVTSWVPGWRYRESALLALLTLALGGLSLHGLNLITSVLDMPVVSGSVILYADQPAGQQLRLYFHVAPLPISEFPGQEYMELVDPSTNTRPSSWAVLLTGDARLMNVTTDAHQKTLEETLAGGASTTDLSGSGPEPEPGQLFWGQLAPGDFSLISGEPIASYISVNATETAVSLPDFMVGSDQNTDKATMSAITRGLGAPRTSPGGLSIGVDAGSVSPLDEAVTAVPPLTNPSELSWTFNAETAPAYKLIDQNALDSQNSYSFALAVLLGVAGAGLLASIQALVSTAGDSRKEQPNTPRRLR